MSAPSSHALAQAQASPPVDARTRRIALLLGGALLLWFITWLAVPMLFDPEIPGDNLEQLEWARHPALGYSKHPPFPTWIVCCFQQLFAPTLALTYFLGALQVGFLMWMAWRLARESLQGVAPWIAPLMVACITYYASRMHYYNHNTALMTAYAGSLLALWMAVATNRLRWWALLGVAWAAGMLSKYQMTLLIGCSVLFLWDVHRRRLVPVLRGFVVACSVAALLVAPHVAWLVRNHFPSFGYASETLAAHLGVVDRARDVLHFLLHQAGRLAPLLALLGVLALYTRTGERPGAGAGAEAGKADAAALARRFWAIHAWGPIAGISLIGLLFGSAVETHWGMASLWAMPFWILCTQRGRRWASAPWPVIGWTTVAVQSLMVAGYFLGS